MTKHGHAERPVLSSKLIMKPDAGGWPRPRPDEPPARYVVQGLRDGERRWIERRESAWYIEGRGRDDDAIFGPYETAEAALAALQRRENTQQVVRTCRCYRRTRITTLVDPDVWPVKQPMTVPCAACSGSIHALLEGEFVGAELVPKAERAPRQDRRRPRARR